MKRSVLYRIILLILIGLIFLFHESLIHAFTLLVYKIQYWQNQFQRTLSQQLAAIHHGETDNKIVYSLMTLSWLYGVLHAAGPGHGKAIITTWALTQRDRYGQILLLSSVGALLQAVSALFWVSVTIGLAQWLIRDSLNQSVWMNRLSYALLIMIGIYIIGRALGKLQRPHHHCHCCHQHEHHHVTANPNQHKARILAILAIGMRPCSGALIILSVAASWQLWTIGIIMTFAMAVGTAFTVGLFGLLVTFGHQQVAEAISASSFNRYRKLFNLLSVLLGLTLCSIGIGLIFAGGQITSL